MIKEKTEVFKELRKQITNYKNEFDTKTLIFNQFKEEL